jgi:predicted nucleic-acid-binding protein
MKTEDERKNLMLIKHSIILNMLQQPNCSININKTSKNHSTNIKPENSYLNNSETVIPNSTKSSMVKFLAILKLIQRPHYYEDINKILKNRKININIETKTAPNEMNLIKNPKNKLNPKFVLFFRQVTFNNNSQSTKNKGEIYPNSDDIYETYENQNDDFFESSTPTSPIIIEEKDMIEDIDIANE